MDDSEFSRLNSLIGHLYEGATRPEAWPEIVEKLSQWIGATKAALFTPTINRQEGGISHVFGWLQEELDRNFREFPGESAWMRKASAKGYFSQDGAVILGEELISPEELAETRWYKHYLEPLDIHHMLTCILFSYGNPSFPLMCFSSYRGRGDPPFTLKDKERLSLIAPHISRSMGVLILLGDAKRRVATSLAALDRISQGIALLGPAGDLEYANPAAHGIFATDDGLGLWKDPGRDGFRLHAKDRSVDASISRALRNALGDVLLGRPRFSKGIQVPRGSGRPPYVVRISNLAPQNEFNQGITTPRAIAFITDPAAPIAIDPSVLQEAFELTRAESLAAASLCKDGTLEQVASELGVTINTLKTQLQLVYAKTGTHSRAHLAKVAAALATE